MNKCERTMKIIEINESQSAPEDLSERSESSRSSVSEINYENYYECNNKNSDEQFDKHHQTPELPSRDSKYQPAPLQSPNNEVIALSRFVDFANSAPREMPIALDKPKDYAIPRAEAYESANANEATAGTLPTGSKFIPQAVFNYYKDMQESVQKSLDATFDKINPKDFDFINNCGQKLDRMKDFRKFTTRMGNNNFNRPCNGFTIPESSMSTDAEELKALHMQSRNSQIEASMVFERLRHSHQLFHNDSIQISQNHLQAQPQHNHHPVTQITQIHQQSQSQQHSQSQQQQQAKSFTIDAILGLRESHPRDKHHRYHAYRKAQGLNAISKRIPIDQNAINLNNNNNNNNTVNSESPSNVNNNCTSIKSTSKLKRVRTIFTTEQLERLEGEFARQQYMVGPERLYLAHALRLTEAQVKVWFQNRRIKWRKINLEQQSQRVQQNSANLSEREDSNGAVEW